MGTKLLSVIGQGGAQSWQMDNRGQTMLDGKFDYGFALDWMIKDLGIVLERKPSITGRNCRSPARSSTSTANSAPAVMGGWTRRS